MSIWFKLWRYNPYEIMTFQICEMNGTDFKSDLLWQRKSIIFEARLQMERETEKKSQGEDKIVKILTPGRLFWQEMRKDKEHILLDIRFWIWLC